MYPDEHTTLRKCSRVSGRLSRHDRLENQPIQKWLMDSTAALTGGWSTQAKVRFESPPILLMLFRKMRFMACYTLPAPIAIDKNIRKAILGMKFSVIAPCPAHTADIRGIAMH